MFESLGSSIVGVDEGWFRKLKHINSVIDDLKNLGMDIKYIYDSNMNLIITCYQDKHFLFKYLDIDNAIGFVTDLYYTRDFAPVYNKYQSFVILIFDEDFLKNK